MEKVKAIAWWIVAFLLFSCALASFPSFGCLLFLIGVAVSLPLSAVRDFWVKKGLRGASKIALVVALLIAGSLAAPDSMKERGAEKEPLSEAEEVVETAQSASNAESVPEDEEPPLELKEVTEPEPVNEPAPVEEETEPEVIEEPHDPLDELAPESVEYDDLQKLYVTFPLGASFPEAIEFLDAAGLPYSSVKYNGGSRTIQVSTEKDGTAQKYNKSGLPYVTIHYRYPSDENSRDDVLEKYRFLSIEYIPRTHYYFKTQGEKSGTVRRGNEYVRSGLTREEQIAFFLHVQG